MLDPDTVLKVIIAATRRNWTSVRARRTSTRANKPGLSQGAGRRSLLQLAIATFVALTLSFMSFAMSSGTGAAYAAPAAQAAMNHCADQNEPSPEKRMGSMDCAIACAAVQPLAPEMAPRADPVRSAPPPQASPCLKGVGPNATSPPPRLLPEV